MVDTSPAMLAQLLSRFPGGGNGAPPTPPPMMTRSPEGFLQFANRTQDGQVAPPPMLNTSAGRIATLQNQIPSADTNGITPDDYTSSPLLYNQSDAALAKSQIARVGSATALPILQELNGGPLNWNQRDYSSSPSIYSEDTGTTHESGDTGFNYNAIKPVKTSDDLLGNQAFIKLAQTDPALAAKTYKGFTGSDFATDVALKATQHKSLVNNYQEGIQKGFISGDLRRDPDTGWLERRRMVPDPMNIKPPTETWEPADEVMQQADQDFGVKGTGYERPPMAALLDSVPISHKNAFIAEYTAQKAAGKSVKDAAQAALMKVKSSPTSVAQMLNPQQPTQPTAQVNPPQPTASVPTDPDEYQKYANTQAINSGDKFGTYLGTGVPQAISGVASSAGPAASETLRFLSNAAGGLANLIPFTQAAITGQPSTMGFTQPSTQADWESAQNPALTRGVGVPSGPSDDELKNQAFFGNLGMRTTVPSVFPTGAVRNY